MRKSGSGIQEEWFGLILLPLLSFAADGMVSIVFFIRSLPKQLFGKQWFGDPKSPDHVLAEDRAIDLSIQFTLLWLPILVLAGWCAHKSFTLLFGTHLLKTGVQIKF